jgi:protein-L-isoaspartate(D-aspartate) O-methyltransferase
MIRSTWVIVVCLVSAGAASRPAAAQTAAQYEQARRFLVEQIIMPDGVQDPRVLKSMRATLRHEFVPADQRASAYYDMGLPIGEGQTISSPFIVAFMTEQLDPQPADRVLEIGTGSGYQAAVLSPLVKEVYTIEIVEPLGLRAERTLKRLGYTNVFVRVGDGFQGWAEHAPFDKIIVTCSPEKVPQPLVDQLREGGLMVVPVGEAYQQQLYLMRKKDGKLESEKLQPTLFVPMTGQADRERQAQDGQGLPGVLNGNFEQPPGDNGYVSGWYYQRLVTWETGLEAPEGEHFISIRNQTPGRMAHIMQGFAADGRTVTAINASIRVKYSDAKRGRGRTEIPAAVVTFYDENRKEVGTSFLGVFLGSGSWQKLSKEIRVPTQSRQAILRLGLFGSTGEVSFDDIRIEPAAPR